jgi:hypothetical protein
VRSIREGLFAAMYVPIGVVRSKSLLLETAVIELTASEFDPRSTAARHQPI